MQDEHRDLVALVKNSVSHLESLVMHHVENEVDDYYSLPCQL